VALNETADCVNESIVQLSAHFPPHFICVVTLPEKTISSEYTISVAITDEIFIFTSNLVANYVDVDAFATTCCDLDL